MYLKKQYLFPLIAILLLGSCTQDVTIELPEIAPKITVNAIVTPDDSLFVYVSLSKSKSEGDFDSFPILDTFFIDYTDDLGHSTDFLETEPGKYRLERLTSNSGEVRIKVSAEGYGTVSASTTIPAKVEIEQATFKDSAKIEDGEYFGEFAITFTDPPNTKNYFAFHFGKLGLFDTWFLVIPQKDDFINFISSAGKLFMTDELIAGKKYTAKFYMRSSELYYLKRDSALMRVNLQHCNYPYFQYTKTSDKQLSGQDNPFAEPAFIYQNIDNGIGIFGSFTNYSVYFQF